MTTLRLATLVLAGLSIAVRASADDAPLFRLFLKSGASLVSFGEMARLEDRVVFSMPTSADVVNPDLHLVTIPVEQVDWEKTISYSESARATRYLNTRAASDYAELTTAIAQLLNDVALTSVPAERLAIVEKARRALAEWPSSHFGYKQDEIHEMLGTLDEVIITLHAATGAQQFDLALMAPSVRPIERAPLMAAPTPQESIEQTLLAARLSSSVDERTSLLMVAAATLDRDAALLPPEWMAETRRTALTEIERERSVDQAYQALDSRIGQLATARAGNADVRGVERLLTEIKTQDAALGRARPDAVNGLLASVDQQLSAARLLRLERDRWTMRLPELRRYRAAGRSALARLAALKPALEDIKALAGATHLTLEQLEEAARQVVMSLSLLRAPDEYQDVHARLTSAAQLASSAATIRREAVLGSDLSRAWDASSAAAGAIMLTDRAQAEILAPLRPPQLPR